MQENFYMDTEVVMKRELFGEEISQKSKSEFFSATDLIKAGNKYRVEHKMQPFNMHQWLGNKSTKEFISALELKFGKVYQAGRGRGIHTWVHPFLFIDLALAIDPNLKIEVYDWLYDYLLRYRNDSGDSYKTMTGSLYQNMSNKKDFQTNISALAKIIQKEVGCKDWQKASQEQLKHRDMIHEYVALYCDLLKNNNREAIRLGILRAKKWKVGNKKS